MWHKKTEYEGKENLTAACLPTSTLVRGLTYLNGGFLKSHKHFKKPHCSKEKLKVPARRQSLSLRKL
jgi:hypothetical protein